MSSATGADAAVLLLDGGMGQELLRRGVRSAGALWSAAALIDAPEVVEAVHDDFLAAGADVITTNSYALARPRLEAAGLGDRLAELNRTAVELAVRARDRCGRAALVAGSLPPLFGTFRPDLVRPLEQALPLYREQVDAMADRVDLFLCETMSSGVEARAAATAAAMAGKPVWVSWTLADGGRLRSGETVAEAVGRLADLPVEAFLANCCGPESITAAMPALAALGRCGGYANGFVEIPQDWVYASAASLPSAREDLDPETYARHVQDWIRLGAGIVGGCCEIGPEHIARLRALIG